MVLSKKALRIEFENLLEKLPQADDVLLEKAFSLCKNKEKSLFIANLLVQSGLKKQSILASMLLDVDYAEIQMSFGSDILELVKRTREIEKIYIPANIQQDYENEVVTMLIAFAEDVRVVFLLIINTLYLLTFEKNYFSKKEIKNILRFMSPIAFRLNLWDLKIRLENVCLALIYPNKYFAIQKKIAKNIVVHTSYIKLITNVLNDKFRQNQIKTQVSGRIKHIYSIYKKIELKKIKFEEIYDLIALRVLVDSVDECYRVLGIVHNLWKPKVEKIKDYIAVPKPNNYKSLHTTVMGPQNQFIEIQIRTHEMDHEANFGIAAHWTYAKNKRSMIIKKEQSRWAKSLLNLKTISQDAEWQNTRIPFYRNNIFVFTNTGKVLRLKKGATLQDCILSLNLKQKKSEYTINGIPQKLSVKLKNCDLVALKT